MVCIEETWESIWARTGGKPLRRGRGTCPFCDSRTGFSVHEEKGFHCFACNAGGDKIGFIQKLLSCEFKEALRWFGLEPGKPPEADPEVTRRQRIRAGLRTWAQTLGKQLRYEHYVIERVIARAEDRLRRDPEDEWGWSWLAWAYRGQEAIAYQLDLIDGTEAQQIEAYRQMRRMEAA
jgi:CHC2 zinc finger